MKLSNLSWKTKPLLFFESCKSIKLFYFLFIYTWSQYTIHIYCFYVHSVNWFKNQFQSTFISGEISFVYMHGNIDDTYQRTNFLFFYFDESKCILLCIRPVTNNTSATLKTKIICFGALKEVGKERRIALQNAKCSQNSSKDLIIVIFDIWVLHYERKYISIKITYCSS